MPDNQNQTPTPQPQPEVVPQPPPTGRKINFMQFLIAGIVILLVIAVGGFFLLGNKTSHQQPEQQIEPKKIESSFNFKSGVVTTLLKGDYQRTNGSFYYHDCMFSADGYHTACLKYTSGDGSSTQTLVVDGEEKDVFADVNGIKELQYSPDGKLAYITQKNDQMVAIIDGKEGKPDPFVGNLTFSQNGKHYAYCIGRDKYEVGEKPFTHLEYKIASMVLDGRDIKSFAFEKPIDNYCQPVFSPDGNKIAYSIADNGKNLLLLNETEIFSVNEYLLSKPLFSGDNTKIYFVQSKFENGDNKGSPILIDLTGKILKKYDRPAYADDQYLLVNKNADKVVYVTADLYGANTTLYLNDNKITTAHSIWNPTLSPDGNMLIYTYLVTGGTVMIGDNSTSPVAHVILNGKEIDTYRTFDTRVSPVVLSKNGKYLAYVSDTLATGSKLDIDPTLSKLVIASGQQVCKISFNGAPLSTSKTYTTTAPLTTPTFASDNEHIGFGYKSGPELIWNTGTINMDSCSLDN